VGEGGDEVSVARFIADQRTFYRVPHAACCAILGVSISWFYKWIDCTPTRRGLRRAELDAKVREMFLASEGTYGSPRIHADLVEAGWTVSVNTVADSMRRQGLAGRKPKRGKWCYAFAFGDAFLLGPGSGSFVFDVADGQPEKLGHRVVVGAVPAVLDDLAELVVQRLDRIRGVDDLADLGANSRKGMNRSEALSQARTVAGYFFPSSEPAKAANSVCANSTVGAV